MKRAREVVHFQMPVTVTHNSQDPIEDPIDKQMMSYTCVEAHHLIPQMIVGMTIMKDQYVSSLREEPVSMGCLVNLKANADSNIFHSAGHSPNMAPEESEDATIKSVKISILVCAALP